MILPNIQSDSGSTSSKERGQLLMEVELGMPSKKCRNFGICNVTTVRAGYEIKVRGNRQAVAMINFYDNHVEFDFLKDSLNPYTYREFFRKPMFVVQETFVFSSERNEEFHFVIPVGKYPIHKKNNILKVVFKN